MITEYHGTESELGWLIIVLGHRRRAVTHKKTDPELCMSVRSLSRGVCPAVACCSIVKGHNAAGQAWNHLNEVAITFMIYFAYNLNKQDDSI